MEIPTTISQGENVSMGILLKIKNSLTYKLILYRLLI